MLCGWQYYVGGSTMWMVVLCGQSVSMPLHPPHACLSPQPCQPPPYAPRLMPVLLHACMSHHMPRALCTMPRAVVHPASPAHGHHRWTRKCSSSHSSCGLRCREGCGVRMAVGIPSSLPSIGIPTQRLHPATIPTSQNPIAHGCLFSPLATAPPCAAQACA